MPPKTHQFSLRRAVREAERHTVLGALNHAVHRRADAAELLGMGRPTLYNVIDRCELWKEIGAIRRLNEQRRENPAP